MRPVIIAAVFGALLGPASAAPANESAPGERILLALNPQPEPPGRAKIKRIYSGGPDSRRQIKNNQKNAPVVAPATKY
jgi:hypothetical protein